MEKKIRRILQVTDIGVSEQISDLSRLSENLRPVERQATPAARLIEQAELSIRSTTEDGERKQRQARRDLRVRRVREPAHSLVA